jgi:metallo-beta-lactamase family protein
MASVTFYGACGTVTGSCTFLAWGATRLLVDCGFYQGGEELERRNREPFAFDPRSLTAVVVTHAHLDHVGLLPRLVRDGFSGPIYCTRASRGLVSLVLLDSAEIQQEEARFARRKGYSRHADPTPLYTVADARRTLELVSRQRFDDRFEVAPGVAARFRRAGHLLGAASVEISAKSADGERRGWCFSGDVGRYGAPILVDPQPPLDPPAALLLEATYGDRRHAEAQAAVELRRILAEVDERRGTVVVPAFALGRSQEVLYHLARLAHEGVLDPDIVYLDSPMAIDATQLYADAAGEHDEEMQALTETRGNPFGAPSFHRCRTVEESKALNRRPGPLVIVAASGMAEGGRVVHHLKQRLADPRNAVVFVGFQAAGTRGRALVEGAQLVAIHGEPIPVRAEIHQLASLSAHADSEELVRWCRALPAPPQRAFLNHAEDPARKALRAALTDLGWPRPELPRSGDTVPW